MASAGMNVMESYLIKLGTTIDVGAFNKFQSTLMQANNQVASMTSGAVKDFIKLEGAMVGTFTAIGAGIITLADRTAMADQQYRLLGERMLMGKENARSMQMALDVLGATLAQVTYDPELNERYNDLLERNEALSKSLGSNFDNNMKQIRGLRVEVKQFGTELTFLSMGTVSKLFDKLGYGSGDLLKRFRDLNQEFSEDMPKWVDQASTFLVPIWKDFLSVMGNVKDVGKTVLTNFTNLVGILYGDKGIQGATFNVKNLATALDHVADSMAKVIDTSARWINKGISGIMADIYKVQGMMHGEEARRLELDAARLQLTDPATAKRERAMAAEERRLQEESEQNVQEQIDAYEGRTPNVVFNNMQEYLDYKKKHPELNAPTAPQVKEKKVQSLEELGKFVGPENLKAYLDAAHEAYPTVPVDVLAATIWQESGGKPGIVNPESGTTGMMQFKQETADRYGLMDRTDPGANIMAGAHYLSDLYAQEGSWPEVFRKFGGFLSMEKPEIAQGYQNYMRNFERERNALIQNAEIGSTNIDAVHIYLPPGTDQQHAEQIVKKLRSMQEETAQVVSQQLAGIFY
jgi:hypothetical protein